MKCFLTASRTPQTRPPDVVSPCSPGRQTLSARAVPAAIRRRPVQRPPPDAVGQRNPGRGGRGGAAGDYEGYELHRTGGLRLHPPPGCNRS